MGHDLRVVRRLSTPESGPRAGDDGATRQRGSRGQMAVDTLGPLLAVHVTAAHAQERAPVGQLAERAQEVAGVGGALPAFGTGR
jgi:hypothetical protein